MNENDETRYTAADLREARRAAWNEAELAHYPLVLAVEQFVENGGDSWGNLDDPLDRARSLKNPYDETEEAVPEPPMLMGTNAALEALTIRPEVSS